MASRKEKVRLDHEKRDVWLIKVPPRVAKAWESISDRDVELGSVRIYPLEEGAAEGEKHRITFHLDPSLGTSGSLGTSSDLDMRYNENDMIMRIFSKGDGGVDMQGLVEYNFVLQPMISQNYNQSVQKRVQQQTSKTRHTMEASDYEMSQQEKRSRVVKMDHINTQHLKRRKLDEDDEAELRAKIFRLFAKKDAEGNPVNFWRMRDLKNELGETEAVLGQVLAKICNFHRDGPFANKYELKPEFRS